MENDGLSPNSDGNRDQCNPGAGLVGPFGFSELSPLESVYQGNLRNGPDGRIPPDHIQVLGRKVQSFCPTVVAAEERKKLCWRGRLVILELLDGGHYFRIEPLGAMVTRLTNVEKFSGILAGLVLSRLAKSIQKANMAMNRALKERVERAAEY